MVTGVCREHTEPDFFLVYQTCIVRCRSRFNQTLCHRCATLLTGRPTGASGATSRAARSAVAAVRAALSELAKASEFAAPPRRRDERPARA